MRGKILSILICTIMTTSFFGSISQNFWEPAPNPQNVGQPSSSLGSSGGLADSPWPMFRQNLNHTGLSPYDTSGNPGKLKWSFETGHYVISSPSIGPDGTIYVGSEDRRLYAINPNGTQKWNFTANNGVPSSPTIGYDGTIYFGSYDGNLYAINSDGTLKWIFAAGMIFSSPAIGLDGTIYIGSYDHKLYAVTPDGSEKWSFTTDRTIYSSPAIGSDGIIYFGSDKLYAINPDGTEKWNFTTGSGVESSPAIGSDGTIYVGSMDHNLYAINSNGTEKWSFKTGWFIESSPAISSDGTIYVGSWDSKLYAINSDGTKKWSYTTGNKIRMSSPAVGSDGTIYVGSNDNKLYAINPDGTEKWRFITGDWVASSPAIGSDGTIYVGSRDHNLYAIGTLPVANAGPDQTVNEGNIVGFDGSASYDPDGIIEYYEWDFDSSDGLWWNTGAIPDATGSTTSHIYGDNGIYKVTLRVTEDKGGKDTDICYITVNNVAPTINSASSPTGNEGSSITFTSTATDPGSDDLTFTWDWDDGTSSTTSTYYNDGNNPDPYPSPCGTYPFTATNNEQHTYGDNGLYNVTVTVEDDDDGTAVVTTIVTVYNLVPSITKIIAPSGNEGSSILLKAEATDPGSDDLKFSWEFGYGPTINHTFYNNGLGPDPSQSPLGTYPFSATDTVTYTYGDNYNYTLILTVTDDDGGTATYTTTISVDNVSPSIIEFMVPFTAYEGQPASYGAVVYDKGSDDLTFEWNFGDSTPVITNTCYNDGTGPDSLPSPDGTYPFYANDTINHTYGDDYDYTLILKVTDDDGGISTLTTTIFIYNVAPIIKPFGPFTVDEGSTLDITATCSDPGSDDLTLNWEFEMGPIITNVYYNDGLDPDIYPSPGGIFPFSVTDVVEYIYGDNGVYNITLTVEDDDGGVSTYITNITVNNVAPTIISMEAYMYVNFTLRVAGEKWHSVNITLYEDSIEIWDAKIIRQPGSADEQAATLNNHKINIGSSYRTMVDYLPNDPMVNGNVYGGNPVWVIMEFRDGTSERLHHTFNVRQSYWESDHWNHIDPWEVDLTSIIYMHNITFEATATDPGSDDLTFLWDFGDGGTAGPNTYFNNGVSPDLYPSPEMNPMNVADTVMHAYTTSGSYTLNLFVTDDDSGITSITIIIALSG